MNNLGNNYIDLLDYKIVTFLESYNVLQKLLHNQFTISRTEILDKIDYDISLNNRAIDKVVERQNERFKIIFGLENTEYFYNRKLKKYQLSVENSERFLPFKILYDYLQSLIHTKSIDNDNTKLSKVIMFNNEYNSHNIGLLLKLTDAILSKKVIEFNHFNHFRGESATHIVEPWFIKQYGSRFFLGCYRLKKNNTIDAGYRSFTINQIDSNNLKILDKTIDSSRKENEITAIKFDMFEHCIGVRIHREDEPNKLCTKEDIYVETDYTTGKDWLNIPIHKNQKLVEEKSDGSCVFLFPKFYFNDAFKQLVLGSGNAVKVTKPQIVIEELKKELQIIFSKY